MTAARCGVYLQALPIQIGTQVRRCQTNADVVRPGEAFTGAAGRIPGCAESVVEVRAFGLPDFETGGNWISWIGGVHMGRYD